MLLSNQRQKYSPKTYRQHTHTQSRRERESSVQAKMAATVSAWGRPGAWALDSEENEAEQQHDSAANGTEFPSLSAAKTKKKQKKPQAISLHEFSAYGKNPSSAFQPNKGGLTPDELFRLPTGPRERTAEELDRNKLGGGFRSYGGGGREDQPRRQGGFSRDSDRESRADETDDWGAGKKFSGSERRERGGFFGDSQSRADEVDNWASNKSFVASGERRGGFGLESGNGGSDSSNWGKRKEEEGRKSGGAFDSLRERRGGFESNGVDSWSWGRKREEESGGSRPRLNLQPRTLPVVVVEEQKSEVAASVVKPKTSSNPFGEARPREEVLKEKGQDWKEIEEKLDSVKIKEVVSDGPAVGKTSFWSDNGRERLQQEDKNERSWRRPELVDSRPQSASDNPEGGLPEKSGIGIAEDPEQAHSQM